MYYTINEFIRKNDTDNKVKNAIAECLAENMNKELALDTLSEDLQKRLYNFIWSSEELDIDNGSNIQRDFTKAIKDILSEYFKAHTKTDKNIFAVCGHLNSYGETDTWIEELFEEEEQAKACSKFLNLTKKQKNVEFFVTETEGLCKEDYIIKLYNIK